MILCAFLMLTNSKTASAISSARATLTDLMGIRTVVSGKLKSVDLMSNVILIEAS